MTRILLTNDDGYEAPGIAAMKDALGSASGEFDVTMVAPDKERSACGHGVTLDKPLRLDSVGPGAYKCDGTPSDCVLLAARGALPDRPQLVLSGINAGCNFGDDVTYSGTVAAAMEGSLQELPSIAVSLDGDNHFETAAAVGLALVRRALEDGLDTRIFLNVNVPDVPLDDLRGMRPATLSRRRYRDEVVVRTDPRGRNYYWIGGQPPECYSLPGTDYAAVADGFASVTPLHLDLADHGAMGELRSWLPDLCCWTGDDR